MKALVVDESAVMRKVLTGALGQCGIRDVVQAKDGRQAVDSSSQQDFALVVLDWDLPVMSGLDAVRTMRAKGQTMPILVLAGESDQHRALEALKSGATDFVIKPFESATLVAKVKSMLEHREAEAAKG
jgi:two-component system chemotaxis response regulator CheY